MIPIYHICICSASTQGFRDELQRAFRIVDPRGQSVWDHVWPCREINTNAGLRTGVTAYTSDDALVMFFRCEEMSERLGESYSKPFPKLGEVIRIGLPIVIEIKDRWPDAEESPERCEVGGIDRTIAVGVSE